MLSKINKYICLCKKMNKNELPTNITVLDTKSLYDSTEHLDRLDRLDRLDNLEMTMCYKPTIYIINFDI
jgi:hypothetical protein